MTGNGPGPGNLRWVRAAAAVIAMGCAPLVLAAPAAAKNHDKHLAVDCPPPFSQTCAPRQGISVDTSKDTSGLDVVWFTADPNPPACAPGLVTLYADGNPVGPSEPVQPGGETVHHQVQLSPGTHSFEAQVMGTLGGCNTGAMSGWSGTIHVSTGVGTSTTPDQPPPAGQNTMVWRATGHGTTYNITIDDDKTVQTLPSKDLPFNYSEVLDAKPGDLYQIVVSGKGADVATGCEIDYNGQVVASQPVNNSSAQCKWNVPPN
jgi:hypothetical protein